MRPTTLKPALCEVCTPKGASSKTHVDSLGVPQAAQGLLVDVRELLVAPAHVLGGDHVLEEAGDAVGLKAAPELAHRRGGGHDHGNAGTRLAPAGTRARPA